MKKSAKASIEVRGTVVNIVTQNEADYICLTDIARFRNPDATDDLTLIISPDYLQFIEELKARVVSARVTAARAITHEAILLYWDIGQSIVEKQQIHSWGDSVVEMVAADFKRHFRECVGFLPAMFGTCGGFTRHIQHWKSPPEWSGESIKTN